MTGPTAAEVKALRDPLDPAAEERRRRRQERRRRERGTNDATAEEAGALATAQTPAPSPGEAATEAAARTCLMCPGVILERSPDQEAALRCPACLVLHDLAGNILPASLAEVAAQEVAAFEGPEAELEREIDDERRHAAPEFLGDEAAYLAQLAQLDRVGYDRVRKDAAHRLGCRNSTLDAEVERRRPKPASEAAAVPPWARDDEAWPEAVDGAALAREIVEMVKGCVVMPGNGWWAAALWVVHAWSLDAATISPILAFVSPERRCGKTTGLLLLSKLVPRPMTTASITAPALFRAIERWRPTLLIDEADTFLTRPAGDTDEALRGVLNSGHHRGGAFALRCEGDDHEPRAFSTWSPKVVALVGVLPATVADRSIIIRMARKRPGERVQALRVDAEEPFATLRRKCARWAADNLEALRAAEPAVPAGLHDRAADNWRPLLAVAEALGADWAAEARQAAMLLSGDAASEDESARVQLLADIRDLFHERQVDRLASSEIVEALAALEGCWADWRRGKPLSPPQLARLLRPFGILPKTIRTFAGTCKGYARDAFTDVWSRYLPPLPLSQSVTPSQRPPHAANDDFPNVTEGGVLRREKARKPAPDVGCDGVTVCRGGTGVEEGFEEEQEEEVRL